jgi:hypothetical protein
MHWKFAKDQRPIAKDIKEVFGLWVKVFGLI